MFDQIESINKQIKSNIQLLIQDNKLEKAKWLVEEYIRLSQYDVEAYSIKAVILIMQGLIYEAETTLKNGLQNSGNNFDLLFNLAYVYEITNRDIEAIRLYKMAKDNCIDDNFINTIETKILKIMQNNEKDKNNSSIMNKHNALIYTYNLNDDNIDKLKEIFNILGFVNTAITSNENITVVDKESISLMNIDFIIVLEEEKEKAKRILSELSSYVSKDKLYNYYQNEYSFCVEGFEYKLDEILKISEVELLITGLSYAEMAIDSSYINVPSFNFALSSQDLFYDYSIMKYLLNFRHIRNSVRYCIISLSYYSFDFELSKTSEYTRIHRYLSMIDTESICFNFPQLSIIHHDYLNTDFKSDYIKTWNAKRNTVMYNDNKEVQEYIARHHSQMNHPETVNLNKEIFKTYLELLKENNIKPIIVICPTSKHYYKYFQNNIIKKRFYSILDEFEREHRFQVLDYFDSELFDDHDFWDYSHMNKEGAVKFTKILNKKIIY